MVVQIKSKQKYTVHKPSKKTVYRGRTGPHCCCSHKNGSCCSAKGKRRKH